MEYADLIPFYPSPKSESFYEDLYRKKEFYELREPSQDSYFSHQKIVSRYLSNWTLYPSLLVIHETGTGKSGVASAVFDGLKPHYPGMKCFYISNNETLLENFKNEVFALSQWIQHKKKHSIPYKRAVLSQESSRITSQRNALLKDAGFVFYTYYRLASELHKEGISKPVVRQWTNQLIIMDEVHHLVSGTLEIPEEDKKKVSFDPYQELSSLLDQLPVKKLVCMTATPMRNSPEEIIPLLNLVLPKEERFPPVELFRRDYFHVNPTPSGVPFYHWKSEERQHDFVTKIRGYVSVVRQRIPFPIVYEGHIFEPMQYFRLTVLEMHKTQAQGYERAFQMDRTSKTEHTSFYSHSQQASLFVFPDHSFGTRTTLFFHKNQFTNHFNDVTGMRPFSMKSRDEYTRSDYERNCS